MKSIFPPFNVGVPMPAGTPVPPPSPQAEIDRLRAIIRVNAIRWMPEISHAEIDAVLYPKGK